MRLFYGGCEQQSWTRLLVENGITDLAVSFWGLKRRQTKLMQYRLSEKYPQEVSLFLDSGGHTANSNPDLTQGELKAYQLLYLDFVKANVARLDFFTEFDPLALGPEWIKSQRDEYPQDKLMVVWHPEIEDLSALAKQYRRIGITQTSLKGSNLTVTINNLARKYGTQFHGIGMTKPDEMRNIRFSSCASTSWLSPSQYGDTIIWSGEELKRYPKKYKDRRKMHVNDIKKAGCDPELIEADDNTELLKLSVWSWKELMKKINSNSSEEEVTPNNKEVLGNEVVIRPENVSHEVVTRDKKTTLPILGISTSEGSGQQNGDVVPLVKASGITYLQCDTCFLADKGCPGYNPGSECAFNIPVEMRTKEQRLAAYDSLLQFQYSRLALHTFGEQLQGGALDKNVSDEYDRFTKMLEKRANLENDFSFSVTAKGSGQAGIMSGLFGKEVGEAQTQLPQPLSIEDLARPVLDIEPIDE